jgi:hypothetical protein
MLYTGVCLNGQIDIIGEKGNSIKKQSLYSETARGSDNNQSVNNYLIIDVTSIAIGRTAKI